MMTLPKKLRMTGMFLRIAMLRVMRALKMMHLSSPSVVGKLMKI
jgi:hypothetical protein